MVLGVSGWSLPRTRHWTSSASTGRAAEALGVSHRGTIEPGKQADLVIVRGNLAEDIRMIREIESIILSGRRYDRAELLEEVSALASVESTNQ